jgi:hypothetical protein
MKTVRPRMSHRVLSFVALCGACAAVIVAYVLATAATPARKAGRAMTTGVNPMRGAVSPGAREAAPRPAAESARTVNDASARRRLPVRASRSAPRPSADRMAERGGSDVSVRPTERRTVIFRSAALDDSYLQLGTLPLQRLDAAPTPVGLRCERVHYAAGSGVCLWADRGVLTTYGATFLDGELRPVTTVPLAGWPSRARVSADGRFAAITVFVVGHAYAAANFSTLTAIFDARTGKVVVPDLEKFNVTRDGEPFQAADFNFWGVTFARDSNRFYATLATGGRTFLVEADIRAQRARVIRADVECPSLSPDNRRIAFKQRSGTSLGPVTWRLAVLDLVTSREWPLAETRSVDDQVEWLDDRHVLYALPDERSPVITNTWRLPADGTGSPTLFLAKAYSAVVVPRGVQTP